ncbi:MAG TPA: tRNA pseudouridine(38-40) synthase TruA [Bacteroidales bacterium]|nr:tRNA pseudouridine(38-40) synthase TruA [Bacteroidales bacterium]
MRYFIKLAFNGTHFYGWQIQPRHKSVQEVLETTLSTLLKETIKIVGCGRTDSGVHTKEYYAHFDFVETLTENDLQLLIYQANSILPQEIVIYNIFQVDADLHARFDALSRTYRYYVTRQKEAFNFPFCYFIPQKLNIERMNEAAQLLLQTDDFTSFSKLHTQTNNNICKVSEAFWKEKGELLIFTITADRFLRNMVRAIVGTLLEVGREQITIAEFQKIIDSKNRCKAGYSVPAKALFLEKVRYPLF